MKKPKLNPVSNLTLEELMDRLARLGVNVSVRAPGTLPENVVEMALVPGKKELPEIDPADDIVLKDFLVRLQELGYELKVDGGPRFRVGDRVTRELFMDDGTWSREGDACLDRSPLRHGEVVRSYGEPDTGYGANPELYEVRWDDGTTRQGYLPHGLEFER